MFAAKELENHLEQSLDTAISQLTKKTRYLKSLYYLLSISILFLSALLTVILGFNLKQNNDLILSKNVALVIGAIITFLTGLNTFWRLESYWIRRKILLRRLEDLRDEFKYQKLSAKEEDLDNLFAKYQSIQNYQTIYWEDIYDQTNNSNKRAGTKTNQNGS